jgi:hypothetical protein
MNSTPNLIWFSVVVAQAPQQLLMGLEFWRELGLLEASGGILELTVRQSGEPSLQLSLTTTKYHLTVLETLQNWYDLELLNLGAIAVEIGVRSDHPQLLKALDQWLVWGLLSPKEVRVKAATCLSLPLPEPQKPKPQVIAPRGVAVPPPPSPPREPHPLQRFLSALLSELSVLWLLLLGVLLVVVSSGVLAASQWQHFPPAAQYSILWLYTLGFGGASFWVQKQDHLRLTGQALPVVALLLIPLNFLAMDSFQLGGSILSWGVLVMAAGSLSWLAAKLLGEADTPSAKWLLFNYLGLGYIHWGWAISGIPWLATYGGVMGTLAVALYRWRRNKGFAPGQQELLLLYALVILILRAIVYLPLPQLGLAFGLVGAVFLWLTQEENSPAPLSIWGYGFPPHTGEIVGVAAMTGGWGVTVWQEPGSTLIISLLGLWLGGRRLERSQQPGDLLILWLIGLQSLWLGARLVPMGVKSTVIALGQQLVGLTTETWPLMSVGLFPYLGLTVVLNNYWQKRKKPPLARIAGQLVIALGLFLTVLSISNPCLRTLNFLGSTALGLSLTRNIATEDATTTTSIWTRASTRAGLSHGGVLLSGAALLNWVFPHLGLGVWALLILGLSLGETFWFLTPASPGRLLSLLQAWAEPLALILAAIAHVLLAINQGTRGFGGNTFTAGDWTSPLWGLSWGLIPLLWTGVACQRIELRVRASSWAIWSALLWQALTFFNEPSRWLGLAIASLVLFVNTSLAPTLKRTVLTVGVILGFCLAGLQVAEIIDLQMEKQGLLAGLLILTGLWGLRHYLSGRPTKVAQLYQRALDVWAYPLAAFMVLFLLSCSPSSLFFMPWEFSISWEREAVLGVMILSTYRSGQMPRQGFSPAFSIGVALLAPLALWQDGVGNGLTLAIATGILAWQTQRSGAVRLATVSVAMALLLMVRLLLWNGFDLLSAQGLAIASLTAIGLWGSQRGLKGSSLPHKECWGQALGYWGLALSTVALGGLTLHSFLLYNGLVAASGWGIGAALLLLLAWGYPLGFEVRNATVYTLGWTIELLMVEILGWTGRSLLMLALANVALGLTTQILGDWWQKQGPGKNYLSSLHILPLLYGALGTSLRWGLFNRWSGLTTLGLVVIAVGVGRRRAEFKPLLYAALGGISLAAYELLQYQIQGLPPGEQWLAWAALATTLLYAYGILRPWLADYLGLTTSELQMFSHCHWLGGTFCLGVSSQLPPTAFGVVGLGAALFLTRYALWQGRSPEYPQRVEYWVYLGLAQGAAIAVYGQRQFFPIPELLSYLFPWAGMIASLLGVGIYLLPWGHWYWSPRPWRQLAMVVPLLGLIPNGLGFYPFNFLAIAGFYVFLAYSRRQWPITYVSLILVDLGILEILHQLELITPFLSGLLAGISLFYVAWLEPHYRPTLSRTWGHPLRLVGTGLIGSLSLIYYGQPGFLPALVGIVFIFAGLGLRLRAFLYGGTLTFLAVILYQLGILITEFPLLKWLMGLGAGLGFIWLAATFETQREKIGHWARLWLADLDTWR